MGINFIALDLETANPDMASICQIGLVRYENGIIAEEWKSYINPEDYFDMVNISVHGITKDKVKNAPKFPDVIEQIYNFLNKRIIVTHTHFDRVAISQAVAKYKLHNPDCIWLDSARVSRRAWSQFSYQGYGLQNICKFLNYDFIHHDALEDAKAAGFIMLSAIKSSNIDIANWLIRVEKSINPTSGHKSEKIQREGNPEGDFFGEVLVFTGALEMPRHTAADLASQIGFKVENNITKRTTVLVIGIQISKLAEGQDKSEKHRKAEQFIESGQNIRILQESDFIKLVQIANPDFKIASFAKKEPGEKPKGPLEITLELEN